jgi:Cu-processing system permease protein
MYKISKYVMLDIIRNKFVIGYGLFIFLVSFALLNLEGESSKSILSLLNIVLLVVPLIAVVFATIHFYNSSEFIELMVSQPVKRSQILLSEYLGVALSFSLSFALGMGIPLLLYGQGGIAAYLMVAGIILTFVFISLALLSSVIAKDKARGIGMSLLLWFFFSVIYDGLILILMFAFSDYPIEKFMLLVTSLNPVDLVRVTILMKLDTAALMGYTGAVYKEIFDSVTGTIFSALVLGLWVILPLLLSLRIFNRKDL